MLPVYVHQSYRRWLMGISFKWGLTSVERAANDLGRDVHNAVRVPLHTASQDALMAALTPRQSEGHDD